jgi:hypothetical protein
VQVRPQVPHSPRIQVCLENTSLKWARFSLVTYTETCVNREVTPIPPVIAGLDPASMGLGRMWDESAWTTGSSPGESHMQNELGIAASFSSTCSKDDSVLFAFRFPHAIALGSSPVVTSWGKRIDWLRLIRSQKVRAARYYGADVTRFESLTAPPCEEIHR